MTQLATETQIAIARSALHTLHHAVNEARTGTGNGDTRSKKETLTAHLKAAESAMTMVSGSAPYHAGVRAMVSEFERLEKTAVASIADLSADANYRGQRRSTMTTADKSKFIAENGSEKFLALPY